MLKKIGKKEEQQIRLASQKSAIERIFNSEDGKLLLQYLCDITFPIMGMPCKDLGEYAFFQGQRSLLISLLQFAEKPVSDFCFSEFRDIIRLNERKR